MVEQITEDLKNSFFFNLKGGWSDIKILTFIVEQKLDMIIGPLVPEPHMEEVIDFVTPFYTFVGLSIGKL